MGSGGLFLMTGLIAVSLGLIDTEYVGNRVVKEECDCKAMTDVLRIHTDRLSELIGYERHTMRLLEWQKNFKQYHSSEKEQPDREEDTALKAEDVSMMIEEGIQNGLENASREWQTKLEGLESRIDELNRLVFESSMKAILKKSREQILLEQMSLLLANLTQEVTTLKNQGLPDLESRVTSIENAGNRMRSRWTPVTIGVTESPKPLRLQAG